MTYSGILITFGIKFSQLYILSVLFNITSAFCFVGSPKYHGIVNSSFIVVKLQYI